MKYEKHFVTIYKQKLNLIIISLITFLKTNFNVYVFFFISNFGLNSICLNILKNKTFKYFLIHSNIFFKFFQMSWYHAHNNYNLLWRKIITCAW